VHGHFGEKALVHVGMLPEIKGDRTLRTGLSWLAVDAKEVIHTLFLS
jgi:hypothetical protein